MLQDAIRPGLTALVLAFATLLVAAPGAGTPGLAAEPGTEEATVLRAPEKRDLPSRRLLLPYFEVEADAVDGESTLFAVRNESLATVEIDVKYYEADAPQAPQRTDRFTLAPKEIRTVNLRAVENLEVDPDGFARGYVLIEQVGGAPGALHGDTFQVNPGDNFATGSRLVDADLESPDNDLCSVFVVRFLQGGGFDGGAVFQLWIDTDSVPLPQASLAYEVYDEPGDLINAGTLTPDRATLEIPASLLLTGPAAGTAFGAVELQLTDSVGHLSVTLSALGRYSVGLEATCKD